MVSPRQVTPLDAHELPPELVLEWIDGDEPCALHAVGRTEGEVTSAVPLRGAL